MVDHASNHGGATWPLTPLVCRAVMACVARLTQVTLELVDGSRRSVPTSRLLEASDQQWADAHAAALAQKRSALELATREAYSREQEQATLAASQAEDEKIAGHCTNRMRAAHGWSALP